MEPKRRGRPRKSPLPEFKAPQDSAYNSRRMSETRITVAPRRPPESRVIDLRPGESFQLSDRETYKRTDTGMVRLRDGRTGPATEQACIVVDIEILVMMAE